MDHADKYQTLTQEVELNFSEALIVLAPITPGHLDQLLLTASDLAAATRFGSETRKAAFLTWRSVVRRRLGEVDIAYSDVGAPYILNSDYHIGVSHTGSVAAVIFSKKKCAIDIEHIGRDFSRAASRFISSTEASLRNDVPHFDALLWCTKESLYKISGRRELDFLTDMRVTSVDAADATLSAHLRSGANEWEAHQINTLSHRDIIGTWMTS